MQEKKYLKWYHKIGYGSGDIAGNCVYALLTAFMMIYLTDTIGLSMGIVSTLIAVSKIFDGVSDFFFGRMIDKTKSKMGKARPWMLWGYVGCAITLVACFSIPTSWGQTAQYIFFFLSYTLLNAVFFTANNIAYASLTALITKNTSERVQIGSFRFIFAFATKIVIEAVTIFAVGWLGGGVMGWRLIAIIYAVVGLITNTLSVFSVKELPEEETEAEEKPENKLTFLQSFKVLLKNKYYIIISCSYILTQLYASVIGMGTYYAKYILGNEELFSDLSLGINITMVVALTILPYVIKKMGGIKKPLQYYRNNLDSTLSLVETMEEFGCRKLVFSSSATVYGPNNPHPYREEMPAIQSTSPYGWTKVMIERILTDYCTAHPDFCAVLLRYFNPIGAHESGLLGDDPNGIPNNLMPYIGRVAAGQLEKLTIFGGDYDTPDGTCQRDYLHVVDLAIGHLKALEYAETHDGVEAINLGTGNGISVLELVTAFEKANDMKLPYVIGPRRDGDLPAFWADATKAKELLGWKATHTVEDMCKSSWKFAKENKA